MAYKPGCPSSPHRSGRRDARRTPTPSMDDAQAVMRSVGLDPVGVLEWPNGPHSELSCEVDGYQHQPTGNTHAQEK